MNHFLFNIKPTARQLYARSSLVGAPGFEPEPRAPKARMPALTPYPDMVGSAALESASQPFQGCATPSQLTPQLLTLRLLFQKFGGHGANRTLISWLQAKDSPVELRAHFGAR